MSNVPGSTDSVKVGNLKKRLPTIVLANYVSTVSSGLGVKTLTALIRGLNGVLNGWIGIGGTKPDQSPVDPSEFVAGMVTIQFIPQSNFPDRGKVLFRPVFQDPAAASPHANNPLPQDAPFSYNFPAEVDEIRMVININTGLLPGESDFNLVLQGMVEYNGAWWDSKAVELAFGQVQWSGPSGDILIVGTGGG